ncbi:MAG: 50S ribosomal protein L11 methyltransferase [Succinivibrionaceae bacterium]|nr:50S ribosomal protein L11 methyltransferase [Succinivibrionaceae bacterium]
MPWIQIKIRLRTGTEHDELVIEKASSLLTGQGAMSVTYTDAGDNPVYEPLPGETKLWSETIVTGLFDAEVKTGRIMDFVKSHLRPGTQVTSEILEDKDWVREWMDHFKPMKFGRRLWICPSWCKTPDPDAVNLMLDPGLAFGTGTHPTTAMCLEFLDGESLEGKHVIDFGCGSGILAIAALLLGAKSALGLDIDPQAIKASGENAERNGVRDRLALRLTGGEAPEENEKADVLVANILAGPLTELAPDIEKLVKKGGHLALSGILGKQADDVRAVYSQWFDMDEPLIRDDWCRLTGIRK